MVKFKYYLFISFFILNYCTAQITFQKSYQDQGDIYCVRQTSDSGFIAVGTIYPPLDFFILKTNELGDTIWTRTFVNSSCMGISCSQNSDGGYIITGIGNGVVLIRIDTYGDTLWTKKYDSPGMDGGWSAHETRDSGFIISGFTNGTGQKDDVCLIKTNAAGDTLWTKAFRTSSYHAFGSTVYETSDQGFIISGMLGDKMILLKTNSIGDTVWTRAFGISNGACLHMKQTSDSGFVLIGTGAGGVLFIKTDSIGMPEWSKTYEAQNAQGRSVDVIPNGGYILSGFGTDSIGTFGFAIRTDSIGDALWSKSYRSTSGNIYSGVYTKDSGFVFAGANNSSLLIKTDSNGNSQCNEGAEQFIVSTPGNTMTPLNIFISPTQFAVLNPEFQISSGSNYSVLCSSVGLFGHPEVSNNIVISPNPCNQYMTLSSNIEVTSFEIYNQYGKKIREKKLLPHKENLNISTSNLANGLYFIKINSSDMSFIKKFIKN